MIIRLIIDDKFFLLLLNLIGEIVARENLKTKEIFGQNTNLIDIVV